VTRCPNKKLKAQIRVQISHYNIQ